MNRRNGAGPKLIGVALVVVIAIYGLYSFNDIQSKLRTAEEKTERLRQQYDSLSAQLQVVYEHKSRLEKSLQSEKSDHKKTRDDLIARKSEADAKFATQKQELMNRVSTLNQEYKMLQSQHEDLQAENTKLQESLNKLQEDHKQQLEQHGLEFRQMQQDKENDIAKLRDEIANLDRRYKDDLGKLQGQNQQLSNQVQVSNQALQFRQQQLNQEARAKRDLQGQLAKAQLENNELARQQQQQALNKQSLLNQQNAQLNANGVNQFNQNANPAVDQNQQHWLEQQNKLAGNQLKNDLTANKNLKLDLNSNNQLGAGLNANLNANSLIANGLNANSLNTNLNNNQIGAGNLAAQNQAFQGNLLNNNLPNVNLNSANLAAGLGDLNNIGQQNQLANNIPVNPQESVNMQIALPGEVKHPGYHEVKDVDPADKLHHQKELAGAKVDNNENLPDNKGPIVMQQPAPNLLAKKSNTSKEVNMAAVAANQVAPPRLPEAKQEPVQQQLAAPAGAIKDNNIQNNNLQAPDVRNDVGGVAVPQDKPVQAIPPPLMDKKNDAQFGDGQQEQVGGARNALDFQAPQPDLKDHNMDTFRNDKIRNLPGIIGGGGINQPDPDLDRIKAPAANDNQQIPLPVNDAQGRDNPEDDDEEDDKYEDGNDEGRQQGQVLPPIVGRNDGQQHGLENAAQENQVPVPHNNNNDNNNEGHNLLAQGQPVADHNADYDKAQPVPQGGDDNDGDYQEDEDEDNRGRLAVNRDFQ